MRCGPRSGADLEPSRSRFREIAGSSVKVGVATVASLLGWVVGGKILALELGAAGVGVFGLLRQLLQNLSVVSTFNGATALVQGLASRSGEPQERYTRAVGWIYAIGGVAVAAVLMLAAPWLGHRLVPHPQAPSLVRWLALALLAVTAQGYFVGLLNGHRAVDALVRAQIVGPVAVLLIAYPVARLTRGGDPAGLVLMLAVPAAVVAIAAARAARRAGWVPPRGGLDRAAAGSFFRMSVVLVLTGLLTTGTQYLQNRLVAERLGLEQSGMFWVAWTLSMTYVSVLLGSYGTYYMPALTALEDPRDRNALIRDYLRLALLVMPVLVSLVVVVKPWVVVLMFSPKLLPALSVMRWMLIGDLLKGVAWVLAFPMLAFNEMRWFFWTEVVFSAGLLAAAAALLAFAGTIEALGAAFAALYACYLVVMWWYVRRMHGFRVQRADAWSFVGGLAFVVGMSWLTWSDVGVRPVAVLAWIAGSAVLSLGSLNRLRWPRRARVGVSPADPV